MDAKKISLIAIFLWVALIVFVGIKFVKGTAEKGEDGRSEVSLTKSEKVKILGEMRQLMQAIQGITDGIEKNDMKAVAEAAHNAGTAMMVDDSAELIMKLPLAFKTQGISTHKYFDTISEAATKGASRDRIISMMNIQLKNCVSCHAGYQFKVE